jgi:GDP-mannose 6-dehydrogenase
LRYINVNIGIFGLGYVGTVSAVCLSNSGHRVIGVDSNSFKVESINHGKSPIVEPGVDEFLHRALSRGSLSATCDVREAVMNTDISLLCVGTPSNANGSLCLDQVMRVCEQIGTVLKTKPRYHGIVVRSTVLPGTIERAVSVIEKVSGKKALKDFGVASNPEFLREGTSIFDFENPPYTVVGTEDDRTAQMLKEMYNGVNAPFRLVRVREAELLKYACNSFHAVKVTFANEIGAISKKLGIDSHAVMTLFTEDTKLNISPSYLKPGFAFGGSCLPKDVRAITYESRVLDVSTPLLDSLVPSNEVQIQRVIDWVIEKKKNRIGVLGLSFKSDTDDLRESPVVKVVETLLGKGFSLAIYDSNVNLSKLVGANRSYIEQEIPHISSLMKKHLEEVLDHSDIILIANRGAGFDDVLKKLRRDQLVLDLVRISKEPTLTTGLYEGISW